MTSLKTAPIHLAKRFVEHQPESGYADFYPTELKKLQRDLAKWYQSALSPAMAPYSFQTTQDAALPKSFYAGPLQMGEIMRLAHSVHTLASEAAENHNGLEAIKVFEGVSVLLCAYRQLWNHPTLQTIDAEFSKLMNGQPCLDLRRDLAFVTSKERAHDPASVNALGVVQFSQDLSTQLENKQTHQNAEDAFTLLHRFADFATQNPLFYDEFTKDTTSRTFGAESDRAPFASRFDWTTGFPNMWKFDMTILKNVTLRLLYDPAIEQAKPVKAPLDKQFFKIRGMPESVEPWKLHEKAYAQFWNSFNNALADKWREQISIAKYVDEMAPWVQSSYTLMTSIMELTSDLHHYLSQSDKERDNTIKEQDMKEFFKHIVEIVSGKSPTGKETLLKIARETFRWTLSDNRSHRMLSNVQLALDVPHSPEKASTFQTCEMGFLGSGGYSKGKKWTVCLTQGQQADSLRATKRGVVVEVGSEQELPRFEIAKQVTRVANIAALSFNNRGRVIVAESSKSMSSEISLINPLTWMSVINSNFVSTETTLGRLAASHLEQIQMLADCLEVSPGQVLATASSAVAVVGQSIFQSGMPAHLASFVNNFMQHGADALSYFAKNSWDVALSAGSQLGRNALPPFLAGWCGYTALGMVYEYLTQKSLLTVDFSTWFICIGAMTFSNHVLKDEKLGKVIKYLSAAYLALDVITGNNNMVNDVYPFVASATQQAVLLAHSVVSASASGAFSTTREALQFMFSVIPVFANGAASLIEKLMGLIQFISNFVSDCTAFFSDIVRRTWKSVLDNCMEELNLNKQQCESGVMVHLEAVLSKIARIIRSQMWPLLRWEWGVAGVSLGALWCSMAGKIKAVVTACCKSNLKPELALAAINESEFYQLTPFHESLRRMQKMDETRRFVFSSSTSSWLSLSNEDVGELAKQQFHRGERSPCVCKYSSSIKDVSWVFLVFSNARIMDPYPFTVQGPLVVSLSSTDAGWNTECFRKAFSTNYIQHSKNYIGFVFEERFFRHQELINSTIMTLQKVSAHLKAYPNLVFALPACLPNSHEDLMILRAVAQAFPVCLLDETEKLQQTWKPSISGTVQSLMHRTPDLVDIPDQVRATFMQSTTNSFQHFFRQKSIWRPLICMEMNSRLHICIQQSFHNHNYPTLCSFDRWVSTEKHITFSTLQASKFKLPDFTDQNPLNDTNLQNLLTTVQSHLLPVRNESNVSVEFDFSCFFTDSVPEFLAMIVFALWLITPNTTLLIKLPQSSSHAFHLGKALLCVWPSVLLEKEEVAASKNSSSVLFAEEKFFGNVNWPKPAKRWRLCG
jgi:hypothetical protein